MMMPLPVKMNDPKVFRYKPNQRADFKPGNEYQTDDNGFELCSQPGCLLYAINYSGKCGTHGGDLGPAGLTRWERLAMGFIDVEALDDEELMQATTRNREGKLSIRRNIPKTLYSKMVGELYKRHDEKLRGMLDTCIETMFGIMVDDAYEPSDRMRAATWIFERIRGKTAETIKVEVDTAPWQDVLDGIAKMPRSESRSMRGEVVDAEVVPDVSNGADANVSEDGEPVTSDGVGERRGADLGDPAGDTGEGEDEPQMGAQGAKPYDPEVSAYVPGTPEYKARIAETQDRAERIAERKAQVTRARNRRYAARSQGHLKAADAQPVQKGRRTVQPEDIKAPPEKPRYDRF